MFYFFFLTQCRHYSVVFFYDVFTAGSINFVVTYANSCDAYTSILDLLRSFEQSFSNIKPHEVSVERTERNLCKRKETQNRISLKFFSTKYFFIKKLSKICRENFPDKLFIRKKLCELLREKFQISIAFLSVLKVSQDNSRKLSRNKKKPKMFCRIRKLFQKIML